MILDEQYINENGIDTQTLTKLIQNNEKNCDRYVKLKQYYLGKHNILNRKRAEDSISNNRIVCNHAKYITDMTKVYLTGNPITYEASEGCDIEDLKNTYLEQDISYLDSSIVKDMSIYGCAYELEYANEYGKVRSTKISPHNAFVCYSQTVDKKPVLGCYYYKKYDIDNNCTGAECRIYTKEKIFVYTTNSTSFDAFELQEIQEHSFGDVPMIEYINNEDQQGDFEQIISLIDAYNLLMSDRVNDKEQFVEAFLLLKGIEIDDEQARKLKAEKILISYDETGDAKYLSKIMTEQDIKILRDDLKEDIHRFSLVPDLTDEKFGNNLSGVAIKYKLLGFEQIVKDKTHFLKNGLKKRFSLYQNFMSVSTGKACVPVHRVDICFTHNLPANELEIAQTISYLQDLLSNETLINQLPFVSDAKEEAALVRKEKAEEYMQKIKEIEEMSKGGGY